MHREAGLGGALTGLLLSLVSSASAAPCGDDIVGRRVACRCGDTIVTDTRLLAGDPVVGVRCPLDGLTIRARPEAESLTLDLNGLTIEGSDVGIGLRVEYGGADGASVFGALSGSRGVVRGFGIGIVAPTRNALARLTRIEANANRKEGIRMATAGALLEDVVAANNGADGISIHGAGGRLILVQSRNNGGNGLSLFMRGVIVEAQVASNGHSGLVVDGFDNDVTRVRADGNGKHGIVMRGRALPPDRSFANDNAENDLRMNGRSMDR